MTATARITGKVKWYNETRGYGFIVPDAGGPDVFVHAAKLELAGMQSLKEGQAISFVVTEFKGRNQAEELQAA